MGTQNIGGQGFGGTYGGQNYGYGQAFGQVNLPSWAYGAARQQGGQWGGQAGLGGVQQFPEAAQSYGQFAGQLPAWTRGAATPEGHQGYQNIGIQGQGWGGQSYANVPVGLGWTGTQYGEGQSGMGPSSLYQGARWVGQSTLSGGFMGQPIGQQSFGQLPMGQQPLAQQFGGQLGGTQWTGTQYGEGRPGIGPSSLYQGVRWGGEPSWMGQNIQRG